ncbi:peptidylprolyl isomerase [Yeosuana sp. MJ-SS3]|uniref:Peptidylprolyl isomerase n=1 Tax=Gilvirhabdus luticola TaxID=3079858 RepID=A0ABU3U4S3_9FLAO|nr:peptidylprolyl isomerase [Yeosuana sp. MJ-SS3]MDU8885409.1 peptidylprolyl isomerase [Yeosuana sp. MJ-SS3]
MSSIAIAQVSKDDILFTVDDDKVFATEFVRVYNKNLDLVQDESQKDIDAYLELFINYKLKLKEAKDLEFDKKASYLRELSNYKKQLAKNYLTDNKVTDELIAEAYQRTINEVKASHILIKLSEDASPKDTLEVYNEILKLRDRLVNEGFENVKNDVHDGKRIFAEGLGYFSCFKMVYDFENAAYNTNIGEVSMPFRTNFGYHIVQVYDKRKSRGEVTVGNIMVSTTEKDSLQGSPEERIADIYKKLSQGEDFESLAKQFSDDKSSASKGGKMEPFSGGQLSSEIFEDQAFNLKNIGDVSAPFKTKFGWHIIKLFDKKEVESFEELKPELEVKVKRDSRSKLINNALVDELKKRYQITVNQDDLSYFESILNDDYYKKTWTLPSDFDGSKTLVKIESKTVPYSEFGNFLLRIQRRMKPNVSFKDIISDNFNIFLNQNLIQFQEDNLENENEDFANIVGEYRDGLLLFDMMETRIWNVATTDSIGLKSFYESNKENYFVDERLDAIVASSANEEDIQKVLEMLKQGKTPDQIKETLNINGKVSVIFTTGIMERKHQSIPEGLVFKEGISEVYKHNDSFVIVKVKSVLPKELKSFDDSKGKIISDYQAYKEETWLSELHNKYKVNVNQDVLNKVKDQINN